MGRRPGSGLEADCFFFPLSSNWPTSATLLLRPVRFRAFAERCLARTVGKRLHSPPLLPLHALFFSTEREIESNSRFVRLSFPRKKSRLRNLIGNLDEKPEANGESTNFRATVPVDRRCASRNLWLGLALVLRHVCVTHMITVVVTSRHTRAITGRTRTRAPLPPPQRRPPRQFASDKYTRVNRYSGQGIYSHAHTRVIRRAHRLTRTNSLAYQRIPA